MKRFYLLVVLLCVGISTRSQCTHDPLINENDTIICSGDMITLSTQVYDSYQWYQSYSSSSVGSPVSGATGQTLNAPGFGWYTVEATLAGCAEFSNTVLVDEWAFLNPVIVSSGQNEFCIGDSTEIAIGTGDWGTIQWKHNGNPIPGATDSTFWVVQSGTYVVDATPSVCPNIQLTSGVGPSFTFHNPVVPTITWNDPLLTSSSAGTYQWNLNGAPVVGANSQTLTPVLTGIYSVTTEDVNGCEATSDTVFVQLTATGIGELGNNDLVIFIDNGFINSNLTRVDKMIIFDQTGKVVRVSGSDRLSIEGLESGVYLIRVETEGGMFHKKVAIVATR